MPSHNIMHLPGRPGPGLGAGIIPGVLYGLVLALLDRLVVQVD